MKMTEKMIRDRIRDGEISANKVAGQYRIDREEIDWWLWQEERLREKEAVQ